MDGAELKAILCRLEPGMSLTVPDEWIDRKIAGSRVERARLVAEIARQLGCACVHGHTTQRFDKLDYPRTG